MILVDTSVWISFLRNDNQGLTKELRGHLRNERVFTVSAVFGELHQGARNKRERSILEVIYESLPKVDEDELFLDAGRISNAYKLHAKGVGLVDAYLLAACKRAELSLWSLDKKLVAMSWEVLSG